jgi:hypothetical protein
MKKIMSDILAQGISLDDALMHQVFLTEYLWKVTGSRPYPKGRTLKILDLNSISLGDIGGDVFAFLKKTGSIIGDNNPERLYKVFVVNPPSWFNVL